jgi:hypothetical protein
LPRDGTSEQASGQKRVGLDDDRAIDDIGVGVLGDELHPWLDFVGKEIVVSIKVLKPGPPGEGEQPILLLAWVFLATAVTVGTDDKGKTGITGTSTEKIEILRVRPFLTDTQDRFMLIGRRGTDEREGYWTDPESGEQVKVLESRPVPIVIPWVGFMLIGRDDQG